MKEKRFVEKKPDKGVFETTKIIVDTKTGVNYLFVQSGYAGGLTPLLDRDGKPIVSTLPLSEY